MTKKFMFLLRAADYLHNGKPKAALAGAPELAMCRSQIHGSALQRSATNCRLHTPSSTSILKVNALEASMVIMEDMNFTNHAILLITN